ncbi:hypothetical protein DFH11DRAFT_1725409 [Phellopilus nigrolimitatus]|nr:hypothetical protein DFH11DRAFT_1725409 [Phellopilus nigrolimitatus]
MRAQPPSRRALRYTPTHWHGHLKPELRVRVLNSCPLHCWHGLGPQPCIRWGYFPAATSLRRTCRASAFASSAACPAATRTASASRSGLEGPGIVGDRCRKKMRRVERRGTLDSVSASQQAQMIAHRSSHPALAHSHSQSQSALARSAGQSQHASVGHARATARQDTLLVDHHTGRAQTQSQMRSPRPVSHYREHERGQENRAGSRTQVPWCLRSSAEASGRLHSAEYVHLSQGHAYPSATTNMNASRLASQAARRCPPTPFYINSIYTHEHPTRGPQQQLPEEAQGAEEDTLLDGEGDLDFDTEIARAANGSSSSLSSLTNIISLAGVAASARGELGKRMPMALSSVATMDHAHAVSCEYHTSRGRRRTSQMDELEDGFDGDADGDFPERGSGGDGDVDADAEGEENDAEGLGERAPARATPMRTRRTWTRSCSSNSSNNSNNDSNLAASVTLVVRGRLPLASLSAWRAGKRWLYIEDLEPRMHVLPTARQPSANGARPPPLSMPMAPQQYVPAGGGRGEAHAPAAAQAPLESSTSIRTQMPRSSKRAL